MTSLNIDVPSTVRCLRWYAEAIDKCYDEVAPTARSVLALITREPVGVFGALELSDAHGCLENSACAGCWQ